MLVLHLASGDSREAALDLGAAKLPPDTVWVDLLKPTPAETAFVERTTGLHVPTFADLSEIESSSRLRADDGILYLSAPAVHSAIANDPQSTPVGFVLNPDLLVTVRFEALNAFSTFAHAPRGSAAEVFTGLVEAIVDRIADVLEHIAAELDILSHRLFRSGHIDAETPHRPAREAADLRVILRRVGSSGDLVSKIRDSLLGLGRIVPYVASLATWLPEAVKPRL
jgi:magnesium transporter